MSPLGVIPLPEPVSENMARAGSIIVVVATDAPLLPHQCARLAQRAGLGVARTGGVGEHSSGDLFLAFSTANRGLAAEGPAAEGVVAIRMLGDGRITALFDAVVEATEEAILNALLAAQTMTGRDSNYVALASMPFFFMMVLCIVLLAIFPDLVTWLPDVLIGTAKK